MVVRQRRCANNGQLKAARGREARFSDRRAGGEAQGQLYQGDQGALRRMEAVREGGKRSSWVLWRALLELELHPGSVEKSPG
jgi:hypothetical protein